MITSSRTNLKFLFFKIIYFATFVNDKFRIMGIIWNKDTQAKGATSSADDHIENHETRDDSTGIFMLKG